MQNALGIKGFGFDMLAACSSATFGIQVGADMIAQGTPARSSCINPEVCTSHLNLRDRETHFIFGDAATACVLEPRAACRRRQQLGDRQHAVGIAISRTTSATISDRSTASIPSTIGTPDKLITQKGRKVFKEVVPMVANFMQKHLEDMGIKPSELKRLWLHQANINMNDLIAPQSAGPRAERA